MISNCLYAFNFFRNYDNQLLSIGERFKVFLTHIAGFYNGYNATQPSTNLCFSSSTDETDTLDSSQSGSTESLQTEKGRRKKKETPTSQSSEQRTHHAKAKRRRAAHSVLSGTASSAKGSVPAQHDTKDHNQELLIPFSDKSDKSPTCTSDESSPIHQIGELKQELLSALTLLRMKGLLAVPGSTTGAKERTKEKHDNAASIISYLKNRSAFQNLSIDLEGATADLWLVVSENASLVTLLNACTSERNLVRDEMLDTDDECFNSYCKHKEDDRFFLYAMRQRCHVHTRSGISMRQPQQAMAIVCIVQRLCACFTQKCPTYLFISLPSAHFSNIQCLLYSTATSFMRAKLSWQEQSRT